MALRLITVRFLRTALLAVPIICAGIGVCAATALAQKPNSSTGRELSLRVGDVLRIRVWPDSSLSGEFTIEENGSAFLPAIGSIPVAGRPLAEIRRDLRDRYASAMRMPVVTVTPIFRVSVLGAVERPGLYAVDPSTELLDVISMAGGFRTDAKEEALRIVRGGTVIAVNARASLESGVATGVLDLHSGDRIMVPRRSRINYLAFLQAGTFIATVINLAKR